MNMAFERILVLSPHTDDAEMAAGGTIARLVAEGKDLRYVALSSCEASVPEGFAPDALKVECMQAVAVLGIPPAGVILLDYPVRNFSSLRQEILEDLVALNRDFGPDLILVPSSNDLHQDHRVVHEEALRAFKTTSSILGYEHPWNNLGFTTDVFVSLEERHLVRKIESLKKYESQQSRAYFGEEYVRALAFTRGTQVGFRSAEAFELIRLRIS